MTQFVNCHLNYHFGYDHDAGNENDKTMGIKCSLLWEILTTAGCCFKTDNVDNLIRKCTLIGDVDLLELVSQTSQQSLAP